MKLIKTEDYHEDYGFCIFVSFGRNENGDILCEPPEVCFSRGYIDDAFDAEIWTHFILCDYNFMFHDADPVSFPRR